MVAILVVLTILACIGIDAAIQFSRARKQQETAPVGSRMSGFALQDVSLPEGLFVDPAHTWMAIQTDGKTQVGLDEFLLKAIGRVDDIQVQVTGKPVHRGETLFTLIQGERKIDMPSPIDGIVSAVNEQVASHPDLLRANAYEQGWLCSLIPLNLAKDLKQLSIAEEAVAWLESEVQRFREFITVRPAVHLALGPVMQDGGLPTEGVLEFMDDETWNLFSFEFVRVHAGH